MLTAKSLAESDCGAAEQRNQAAAFLASANELATVLATLETKHGFEPPTAPGLRFCTRGRASFTGYLAWPRGAKDTCGWQSALFGTEAQAHDTAHWRGPPADGTCLPTEGLSKMERDPTKGELSWTGGAGNEEYVFDELCALSFVCWLWPTAMAEELSEQPAYPNYVGASLVVAAGRWAFASEALGGLLKTHRRWARCPLSTTSRTPRAIRRMSSPRGGGPRPIATCPRRPCPGKGNPRSTCPRRRCKWQPCCQGREFQSERGTSRQDCFRSREGRVSMGVRKVHAHQRGDALELRDMRCGAAHSDGCRQRR